MSTNFDPKTRGPPPPLSYKNVMRKHKEEAAAAQRRQDLATQMSKKPAKVETKAPPKEVRKSVNDEKK